MIQLNMIIKYIRLFQKELVGIAVSLQIISKLCKTIPKSLIMLMKVKKLL